MKKVKYKGVVKGKITTITFPAEESTKRLSRFCSNYGADITTFKQVK